ncbi:MAG: peptidylprolyl isomerase [Labilithrix sp.]|nr:peptidylprolyl isomerase [Labilithrix sp.]
MSDRVQRWAFIVASAGVIALVGYLTMEQANGRGKVRRDPEAVATPSASASAPEPAASASASATPSPEPELGDGGISLFNTLLDDAGAMPSGAPRAVRVGVVLVQFAGAEGASSTARSKADALKHARELLEQARTDFKAAVKAGDSGSAEDIGRMPRGVLERSTEVAIFSLPAGEVSEPIETPRGYWIVKRIE